MIRATPEMREFVNRVIEFEMRNSGASAATTPVAFPICEKLRPQWANLMGTIGFRTLLSRALNIALQTAPWLRAVQVKADGSLEWSGELETPLDVTEMTEGSTALIAELLALLEGFIGEILALRLMHDAWPELARNDSDSHKGK
jgi:hypothetical protein